MTDDSAAQQQLLATYRRTLSHLLLTAAQYGGEAFVPPEVANGLYEARAGIERAKTALRAAGLPAADQPDDHAPTPASATRRVPPASQNDQREGVFVEGGGTIIGNVIGTTHGNVQIGTTNSVPTGPERALGQLRQAAWRAQQANNTALEANLALVAQLVEQALAAEHASQPAQRSTRLSAARTLLAPLAATDPALAEVAGLLGE